MTGKPLDDRRIYCPAMGMVVEFGYCRVGGAPSPTAGEPGRTMTLPCHRLPGCWGARIDVAGFLAESYTEAEIRAILGPRATRLDRLYEAASQASGETEKADE